MRIYPHPRLSLADSLFVEQLLLTGAIDDYEYLSKSRREVDGVDDAEEWYAMKVRLLPS